MNLSFKAPQPSPMGMLLSFARAIVIVSADDDVVIVQRHEADSEALRSALARVVELEARGPTP